MVRWRSAVRGRCTGWAACQVGRIRRWVRRRLLGRGAWVVIIKDRRTCKARRMVRRRILVRRVGSGVMDRAIGTTMMIVVGELIEIIAMVIAIVGRRRVELRAIKRMMIWRSKMECGFSISTTGSKHAPGASPMDHQFAALQDQVWSRLLENRS